MKYVDLDIQPVKSTSCEIEAKLNTIENVVSEMANKIYNLKTKLNNLKSLNKIEPVEDVEVTKAPNDNHKGVLEQRKGIVDESIIKSSEETILEITEDIIKTAKAVFKCEICGNTFKKELQRCL